MTDSTVTERETKRADELEPGNWVAAGQLDGDGGHPSEALGAHTFTDSDGAGVLLVYRAADGVVRSHDTDAAETYRLATKAEVEESRDDARRTQVATQLRQLADLITSKRLPLPGPYHHSFVSFNFGRHIEQVDRVAEILGVERQAVYGSGKVEWPSSAEGLLSVSWDAYLPKEPKPERADVEVALTETVDGRRAEHADGSVVELISAPSDLDDDPTGLAYTRADDEPDDPTPVSPARVPMHTGGMTDGGLVDETESRELLAIAPSADGGVAFALAPTGAVVDPVLRAKAVELTEAVAANRSGWHAKGCLGAYGKPCSCTPSES